MVADTLVSAGVVISGFIISLTGWYVIDPLVSILIVVVIIFSTWRLLSDSLRLSLDGLPEGISLEQVTQTLTVHPLVKDVHHIHVWAISTTDNALTAHIVIENLDEMEDIKDTLKQRLAALGIAHSTLEMETPASHCHHDNCCC